MELGKPVAKIDKLNDDCMTLIFGHLPPTDLIKIERVCTRWRYLSRLTWAVRSDKSLDFSDFLSERHSSEETVYIIKSILNRCGRHLRDATISLKKIACNVDILAMVAPYFGQKLIELNLRDMHIKSAGMRALAENCVGIEWLCIHNVTGDFEDELALLLQNCKNLTSLQFQRANTITGRCLTVVESKRLEFLDIIGCRRFDMAYTESVARNLKIVKVSMKLDVRNLDTISKLTSLTVLELWMPRASFADELLIEISRQCRSLKIIRLVLCLNVSNRGVKALLDLPLLNILNIVNLSDNLNDLWNQRSSEVPELKSMKLSMWNLTNMSILNLVQLSPKLENLTLVNCTLPKHEEFVKELGKVVQNRVGDVDLDLLVDTRDKIPVNVTFDADFFQLANVEDALVQ